jgi:hypothetical protein
VLYHLSHLARVKYLEINLTNKGNITLNSIENPKEVKEMGSYPMVLYHETFNIKMTILPKLIYSSIQCLPKFPDALFAEIEKLVL